MSVPIDCYPQKWVLSRSPLDRLGIFKRISRKRGELMLAIVQLPSGFCISGATNERRLAHEWAAGPQKTATPFLNRAALSSFSCSSSVAVVLIVVALNVLRLFEV